MKLKGMWKRTKKEYEYYTRKNWSYKDVGDFWDTVNDYDEIDDETYAYKRRFYDSEKMTNMKEGSRLLDIDCRTGNGTVYYRKKIKEAICVSPSPIFLKVAKKRIAKYGIKGKTMLLRNIPLALNDESFDQILCFETLEHITTHEEFLEELYRVLKPGGEMIVTMPNILWEPIHWIAAIIGKHHSEGPHRFLRRKKVIKRLNKTGFKVQKQKTTVIIPAGPRILTYAGEIIEKIMPETLMHLIALRHIIICTK